MRRILTAVLALALSASLASCGGGKAEGGYETKDVQAMADAGAFSETLEELDSDVAFRLYQLEEQGIEREDMTDCAVLRSAGATCEEGAVLVLDSEEHAKSAKEALEDYVQKQIDENEDYGYRAADVPKLKDAYISVKGNTVLLVVANDLDAAKKAVE